MVDALVRLSGDDEIQAVASLWQRMQADDALHGRVRRVERPIGETQLGGGFDFFSVVLSTEVGVALLGALTTWIKLQRSDVEITVDANGRKVKVKATNVGEAEPTLREILGLPAAPEGSEES